MIQHAQVPEWEAVQMASAVPAAYLGLAPTLGSIQTGAQASMVVMESDFTVAATLIKGEWAYHHPAIVPCCSRPGPMPIASLT